VPLPLDVLVSVGSVADEVIDDGMVVVGVVVEEFETAVKVVNSKSHPSESINYGNDGYYEVEEVLLTESKMLG
jgi:hypothetical protein